MKARIIGTYILTLLVITSFGQSLENDDMYFNSKDREELREKMASQYAMADARKASKKEIKEDELNPTDSYSARTVNPEFSARSNAETAQSDNQDYYINNYRYQTAANLNNFNNNFNNWYGGNWYNRNYWSPAIYGWNSPFYGNYYSSWGNPWNNPYYRGMYSSSFSYYWGSNWDYGWGYDNFYNCPMNNWGWGSGWGPSYAFGFSSFYGPSWYGGYPRVVVVNNNYSEGGRKVVYGKRPSRSTSIVSNQANTRTRTSYTNDSGSGRNNSGGRTSQEYYNKSWRYTNPSNSGNSNSNSNSSYNSNTTTRTGSDGSSYQRSSSGNSNSSYSSPSRSSSSSSYGNSNSGSRSSTPSQSSGSNGRTRGSR